MDKPWFGETGALRFTMFDSLVMRIIIRNLHDLKVELGPTSKDRPISTKTDGGCSFAPSTAYGRSYVAIGVEVIRPAFSKR